MSEIDLSAQGLLDAARKATGLDDFGDPAFREGLDVLLETYETSADLSPAGRRRTHGRLLALLSTRLRVEEAFKRHPEIRDRKLTSPVYLTGLPRTGTSALFNLLAADRSFRPLLNWEAVFPDPMPPGPDGEDPRRAGLRAYYQRDREKNPDFDRIHYVDADGPEECVLLQAMTFCDVQLGIEPLMSPYREWFQAQDLHAPYAYYRDLLKLLDWQRPGERWLLKSPAHLWAVDVLVEMFPDVCIIQTHRDPRQVLASYCSMMEALMTVRASYDKRALGPDVLEFLARSLERALQARDRVGSQRFADVDYRAFTADPVGTVEALFGHFDLPLSEETREAFRAHAADHTQGKHGAHGYSLEEYGLSGEQVLERLAGYVARFGLPT